MSEPGLVSAYLSPCGPWRITVCRLGSPQGRADRFGVLARVAADGTVTVLTGNGAAEPGIGAWRPAGPGRIVVVIEWIVRSPVSGVPLRVSVRAAAELSADGRQCGVRLQWQCFDLDGMADRGAVQAEGEGSRLEP